MPFAIKKCILHIYVMYNIYTFDCKRETVAKTDWISSFSSPSKSDVFFTCRNYSLRPSLQVLFCINVRPSLVRAAPSPSSPQNNVESQLISKNRVEPGRKVQTLNKTVWESCPASTAANCIVLDKLHALTNPEL